MGKPLIKLHDIDAGYGNDIVVHNVSIDVERNDFLGVIGPNGGGKTTILKVILGLLKPRRGSVEYFDENGSAVDGIRMGYLPQYSQIDMHFPISVYETVYSGLVGKKLFLSASCRREMKEQTEHTIERFHLGDMVNCHIGSLSGGQLQRVLLARAVVSSPDVVILDEPNTYADMRFQMQTYRLLHQLTSSCAVIVVGHDVDTLLHNAHNIALVNKTVCMFKASEVSRKMVDNYFLEADSAAR